MKIAILSHWLKETLFQIITTIPFVVYFTFLQLQGLRVFHMSRSWIPAVNSAWKLKHIILSDDPDLKRFWLMFCLCCSCFQIIWLCRNSPFGIAVSDSLSIYDGRAGSIKMESFLKCRNSRMRTEKNSWLSKDHKNW